MRAKKPSEKPPAKRESPLSLRLVHAAVFAAFASTTFGLALPELEQLSAAFTRTYHGGDLPRPLGLLGSLLAAVGVGIILAALARRRSAPLYASGLVMAGLLVALGSAASGVPQGRSVQGSNLAILQTVSRLHVERNAKLQKDGEVPTSVDDWQAALFAASKGPTPVRDRSFRRMPYAIVPVADPAHVPAALVPGQVLLYASPDGASFVLRAVGLDEGGKPALLSDEVGSVLSLEGTFNPQLPPGAMVPRLPDGQVGR